LKSALRYWILLALTLALTGCMGGDDPIPPAQLKQLNGSWHQLDGNASIRFYNDETVKLTMPDENPPLRLLSTLEVIKDKQIGFGVGDRWNGPVHVELQPDGKTLKLIFPGDTVRKLRFQRTN